MRQRFVLFTVCLLLLAVATPAFGQRLDGTIRGTVLDPSGAAVPDAKITVTNVETGTVHKTVSSTVGAYTVPNLLIGPYSVTVEATKYQTYKRTNVQVMAAQIIEVDAKLTIGSSTEIVEVAAGADVVQTESSQLTTTFSFRTVQEVPSVFGANGALSVQNLSVFAPNTTTQLGGTSGNGGSIGGLRGRQNSFTIDGTNNNDSEVSISSLEVMPDAVAEFSLSTNMFAAEYGNAAGGQFNVVTKSGTNTPHGSFFFYNNNRDFNAYDNQQKTRGAKDRFDYNRLGVNVGGPIIKNKLFFFGAYQYQATGNKASPPTASAPTAAGYALLNSIAVDQQVKDLMSQFPVAAGQSSVQPICKFNNRVTKSAGPGDTCVNVPFGAVSSVAPSYLSDNQYIINVDWNINDKHQLRGRQIYDRQRGPSLGTFPQAQFTANTATNNRKMIINEVWNINNNTINDFKATGSILNTNSGIFQTALGAVYPTIQFTGILTVGPANNLPQYRITNTYQLADSLSWVHGKHSFKFGVNYDWFTGPSNFLQNSRGQIAYTGFQEFINDFVPSTNGTTLQGIGSGNFSQNRHNIGWYVQDDFKLNSRLTLNLGLRYDFFGVFKGGQNNALNSVANCPECASNPFFPLVWTDIGNDYNNFSPRIGAAWDPTGSGKWAIRGGFGMGYDILPGNFYLNGQPPQYQAVLNPQTACAGALGAKPVWCPASSPTPSTSTATYLENGAMSGIQFTPPSTSAFARSLTGNLLPPNTSPIVYTWSAGVQREVMRNTVVEFRYLGTKATKLPIQSQINSTTAFANGATALPLYFKNSEIPTTAVATAATLAQFNSKIIRPYAANGFSGVITTYADGGHSRYDGLSVDFSRRMTRGLSLRANYTWSTAHDNATNDLFTSTVNPRRPQDFRNLDSEWSRSALDVQNKVAVTWVYEVPKANVGDNAFGKAFLWGWQASGSYLFQGGQPVTVLSGLDANGNGDSAPDRAVINPNGADRTGSLSNFVCRTGGGANAGNTFVSTSIGGVSSTGVESGCAVGSGAPPNTNGNTFVVGYVAQDPSAKYIQAQPGVLANAGRNTENSGHFNVWNMAFAKNTAIKESWTLQFRADLFNALNHRNFTLGSTSIFGSNTNATSTTYSNLSTSTVGAGATKVAGQPLFLNDQQFNGGNRTIQLGLRLIF